MPSSEGPKSAGASGGRGSGVACRRHRVPSHLIAPFPPLRALQNRADTQDTTAAPEDGVSWTDQTTPRAPLCPTSTRPTAKTRPTPPASLRSHPATTPLKRSRHYRVARTLPSASRVRDRQLPLAVVNISATCGLIVRRRQHTPSLAMGQVAAQSAGSWQSRSGSTSRRELTASDRRAKRPHRTQTDIKRRRRSL